ncbi:uncharacterized protein LOC120455958 [Drosophila santomea]|uniref:uncharacterized protein LOC120455958 n=1 Tax=Drosophila santomea TaxID=129105 RepID=UPI001953C2E8|nr:uncharacterized protein LOC120455958 [Drosophila santomea]
MNCIGQINDLFCHVVRTYLGISISSCETYSIWKFPADFNSKLFYYVLGISVLGALYNVLKIIDLSFRKYGTPLVRMGRPRKVMNLSGNQMRRFRIAECFLLTKAWTLMIYALVFMKPHYINPWVLLCGTTLTIDVFILAFDVMRQLEIGLIPLMVLWFKLSSMCCVLCVQRLLQRLIGMQ